MYSIKTKIFSNYAGYFLKIAEINSQKEKPICPNVNNKFPQNTKSLQSAKISCHTIILLGIKSGGGGGGLRGERVVWGQFLPENFEIFVCRVNISSIIQVK